MQPRNKALEFVIFALGAALLVVACERGVDVVGEPGYLRPPQTPPDPEPERWDVIAELQDKLQAYDRQIAELDARVDELDAEARTEARVTLDELRAKRAVLAERVEALKKASAATWEELWPETRRALNDLEQAYQRALRQLRATL